MVASRVLAQIVPLVCFQSQGRILAARSRWPVGTSGNRAIRTANCFNTSFLGKDLGLREAVQLRCAHSPSRTQVTNQLYFVPSVGSPVIVKNLVEPDVWFSTGIWVLP